jgi:hypothetical protein
MRRYQPPAGATGLMLLIATNVMLASVVLQWPLWVRLPLVMPWLLIVPGWAWARRLRMRDRGDEITVAIAISISLLAIISGVMALAAVWVPLTVLLVLIGVAAVGFLMPPLPRLKWPVKARRRPPRRPSHSWAAG